MFEVDWENIISQVKREESDPKKIVGTLLGRLSVTFKNEKKDQKLSYVKDLIQHITEGSVSDKNAKYVLSAIHKWSGFKKLDEAEKKEVVARLKRIAHVHLDVLQETVEVKPPVQGARALETSIPSLSVYKETVKKFIDAHGGCSYDSSIDGYVPSNIGAIYEVWRQEKDRIVSLLGAVAPAYSMSDWKNEADTVEKLHQIAQQYETAFKKFLGDEADEVGARVCFGPEGKHAVKKLKDLRIKIQERMKAASDPVHHVNDALRGTIVVNTIKEAKKIMARLKKAAASQNLEIAFTNKFEGGYPDGYGGIHCYVRYSPDGTSPKIVTEVQIHFSAIQNTAADCPIQATHGLYERSRVANRIASLEDREKLEESCNSASRPFFAYAMTQIK